MTGWGRSKARRNAREASRALATRRAEIDDFESFYLATRSSIARLTSPDEDVPPMRPRRIPNQGGAST